MSTKNTYRLLSLLIILLMGFKPVDISMESTVEGENPRSSHVLLKAESLYDFMCLEQEEISKEAFYLGYLGYTKLLAEDVLDKNNLLIIADFSLSANTKRLFVIDVLKAEVIHRSLVSHGKNTGEEFAESFSNQERSYKSSLGFYVTGEVYDGRHNTSIKLHGLDVGLNDNAFDRGVVIHAADYVSEEFIKENGRLGRSLGCPALPREGFEEAVELIRDGACFFIYHTDKSLQLSKWVDNQVTDLF